MSDPYFRSYDKDVAESEDPLDFRQNDPMLPQHPARIVICSGSGGGKTTVVLNLMFNNPSLNYDNVIIIAKQVMEDKWQYVVNRLRKEAKIIQQVTGEDMSDYVQTYTSVDEAPSIQELEEDKGRQTLIIIDDMCNEKNQEKLKDIYIGGRKTNSTSIYLTHKYTSTPILLRGQVNYFFFLDDNLETDLDYTARQLATDIDKDTFKRLYKECMKKEHGMFVVDKKAKREDKHLRYRCGLHTLFKY